MKKKLIIGGLILLFLIIISGKKDNNTSENNGKENTIGSKPSVPSALAGTYKELESLLDEFNAHLDQESGKSPVGFIAELPTANGHRGEGLLQADSLPGNIYYLDRLKELGVEGVSVDMPYPVLSNSFKRSEEYWDFYKKLIAEVRKRNMKYFAKVGLVFSEAEFGPLQPNYSKITLSEYFAEKSAIAVRISKELHPDYLMFLNEPASEMAILKKPGLSEDYYVQFISNTLAKIDRSKTLVGAGSGSWDSISFVERFAKETSLDFIDIHVYPLATKQVDFLMQAEKMTQIAKENGKKSIIGEMWLYKAKPSELNSDPTRDFCPRYVFILVASGSENA